MNFLSSKRILRLLAAFALLVFVGDLACDAAADALGGHCLTQTSDATPGHDNEPCSHCACATHLGAVVVADFALDLGAELQPAAPLRGDEQAKPSRLAGSIDHPPQLV